MHRPDEIFRDIAGKSFLTKIDLRSGFHQIKVHVASQALTPFWWKNQLWMYTRMPFGTGNATAHFQRVIDAETARAGLQNNVASFVDDILIYSDSAESHLVRLKDTLKMLESCGLKAHPAKTVIGLHSQKTAAANTDANEAFMKGTSPSDVWLDTPAHKKMRIQRRGKVY